MTLSDASIQASRELAEALAPKLPDPTPEPLDTDEHGLPTISRVRRRWQEQRESMRGIGASDAAAVLGYDRYTSPIALWARLVRGERTEKPEYVQEAARWGSAFEPSILREKAITEELTILGRDEFLEPALYVPSGRIVRMNTGQFEEVILPEHVALMLGPVRHPEHDWLFCHPDGLIMEPEGGWLVPRAAVQVKTASAYKSGEWSEDEETDEIPKAYLVQVHIEMAILGKNGIACAFNDASVVIGGQRYRRYKIPAAPAVHDALVAEIARWWTTYIIGEIPPDPRTVGQMQERARLLWPEESGEERQATADEWELIHELKRALVDAKAAKERADAIKARLMESMGGAYKITVDGGSIVFGTRASVAYKALAEELAGGTLPDELVAKHSSKTRSIYPYLTKLEVA